MADSFHPLIQLYFDQELDTTRSIEVENHLPLCQECSIELKRLQELRAAIKTSDLRFAAPKGLTAKVIKPVKRKRQWLPIGLSLAAACVVLIGFLSLSSLSQHRDAEAFVEAHVRSLMASHLTDVASTSHHTVKPWLGNHLDFSPPVVDLVSAGSPLVGGRLDHVQGHKVAALIYSHGEHTINVFVWPGRGPSHEDAINGYNVEEWTSSGMRFCAVSDVSTDELKAFGAAFRDAAR